MTKSIPANQQPPVQAAAFGARLEAAPHVEEKDNNPSISQQDRVDGQAFRRIPMSAPQAKLATPSIPGFHLHWLNDIPGRINQAIAAGYEFVEPDETFVNPRNPGSDSAASGSSDMGSRISVVVGSDDKGNEIRAYLMKIREEWYKEDQRAAQSRVDAIDDAMRQGKKDTPNNPNSQMQYTKTVDLRSSLMRKRAEA